MENAIHQGDCLTILPQLPANSAALCYADPPFMTGRDFGEFDDRFAGMAAYIGFMRERVKEIKRVLKKAGAFYLHCDTAASHYLKVMCDEEFGTPKFMAEIVWKRTGGHYDSKTYAKTTDRLLVYADRLHAEQIKAPLAADVIRRKYTQEDAVGKYQPVGLKGDSLAGGGYVYEWNGHRCEWNCPEATMRRYEREGRLHVPESGLPYRKAYLHEHRGVLPTDLWTDISRINGMAKEKTGYPTQKPLELLERIIKASSREGETVLDPFCGSGTACVAAKRLGRNFVGIDLNPEAVALAERRLAEAGPTDNAANEPPALFRRKD